MGVEGLQTSELKHGVTDRVKTQSDRQIEFKHTVTEFKHTVTEFKHSDRQTELRQTHSQM